MSKTQEELPICKSTVPTVNGGNSSDLMEPSSSNGKTTDALMFQAERMLKDKLLLFTRNMEELTRDGQSSILTRRKKKQIAALMPNGASTSTDHSSSDQD
jgi:hypothetical protein